MANSIATATRGNITAHDLYAYHYVWRVPVQGSFRGYQIFPCRHRVLEVCIFCRCSTSCSSLIFSLRTLIRQNASTSWHKQCSVLLLTVLCISVTVILSSACARLTSPDYARAIAAEIDRQQARSSEATQARTKLSSDSTTHFSVIDTEGNVVTSTQTINGWFGTGLVAGDTGIVLNNEMDDFAIKPDTANMFVR